MAKIIPGVLTNEEGDYEFRLKRAQSVSDLIQIDIIDGQFAPNNTIGVDIVRKYPTSSKLEVQLMVTKPSEHISGLLNLDFVSQIIFPYETNENIGNNLSNIKSAGKKAGVSVNPETAIDDISDWANDLEILCIFSASPGFSGKKLEEAVYKRIEESKKLFPNLPVEVDIGVNMVTAKKLKNAGADFLVATSALHNSADYQKAYNELAEAVKDTDN